MRGAGVVGVEGSSGVDENDGEMGGAILGMGGEPEVGVNGGDGEVKLFDCGGKLAPIMELAF